MFGCLSYTHQQREHVSAPGYAKRGHDALAHHFVLRVFRVEPQQRIDDALFYDIHPRQLASKSKFALSKHPSSRHAQSTVVISCDFNFTVPLSSLLWWFTPADESASPGDQSRVAL